ncbi:MAG: HAMP domain-containing protein, partial [Deltaproteobacteria bacterium]|nr:HAMP domain-containing protein [Deltaproteobacteria bacterium]
MNASALPDLAALRSRLIRRQVAVTLPIGALAAYVFVVRVGGDSWLHLAVGGAVLYAITTIAQYAVTHRILASAMVRGRDEPPGARLRRLLEIPGRMIVASLAIWTLGGLGFGVGCAIYLHQGVSLVIGSTVIWLLGALAPAVVLFNTFDEILRPVALDEYRCCKTRVSGNGLPWVRQRWLLPSAFVIALVSLVVFCGLALSSQFAEATRSVVARVAEQNPGLAALVEHELASAGMGALWPVAIIGAFLVISFIITGYTLALRQSSAAASIESSLRALVAGTPQMPEWVATDELGDLSFATTQVSAEMQHIFTQLKAMAAGDLRSEIRGESGLLRAFGESRAGMLRLAEVMVALARGELGARPDIAGDLGTSFAALHSSLQAIANQAQKIADGDLRQEVEVPGTLGNSLRRMNGNLRTMVGQSQDGSARLSDLVVNLQGAAS